ncbi:MAG: His/Gly/Thr/Pro-type tRNA ligase C-terminal domain-containing protein [bacterium]
MPTKPKKKATVVSIKYAAGAAVATHYGFVPMPEISIEKEHLTKAKTFLEGSIKEVHPFGDNQAKFSGYLEEKIAIIQSYMEKKMNHLQQPVMIYYEGPLKGNPHMKRGLKDRTFNLEIIGNSKPIAEAIIIETSYVIVKERYEEEELIVELNSVGDKDSATRYTRELSLYFKKHSSEWPAECRNKLKKDIFEIFNCCHEKCLELQENAPKSISYLSEPGRRHFMEVLEYLDSLQIPYAINHKLIGSRSYCSGTLFEIQASKKEISHTVAIGERYNSVSKKVWGKKDIPAIGAAISIYDAHLKTEKKRIPVIKKPKFYFIQLGHDAKLKSLQILETLRQAKIPVYQSLSKDKLLGQIASAEKMEIKYVLIMGQKEAIENSVVVRNMETRSQNTVDLKDLVAYLKKL